MKRRLKAWLTFLVFLWILTTWLIILNYFTPTQIVSHLGVNNSYLIFFLIAAIGGSSLITASSYYITLSVLAVGGLNPLILGFFGGLGVTIGDSLYFYLGSKGKEISPQNVNEKLKKISNLLGKSPRFFIPLFIYFYAVFAFLPNDIMTFLLGIVGYPYKKIFLPLVLGNITGGILFAYLTPLGIKLLGF